MPPGDPAVSSTPAEAETYAADDLDPTKLIFFNVRLQHDELGGGNAADFVLLRRDVAIQRPRSWGPGERLALLRFDLPAGRVHLGGESTDGVGDLYAQALNVHEFSGSFSLASGLAFTLPTASADELGAGKWQVAPTLVPLWRAPRLHGLVYIRIQDSVSFAGDEARRDVHTLVVNPTYFHFLTRRVLLGLDTEALVDWERGGEISWKSGLFWGTFLRHRRAVWVKLEIPWGEHRRSEWTLEASIAFRGRQ